MQYCGIIMYIYFYGEKCHRHIIFLILVRFRMSNVNIALVYIWTEFVHAMAVEGYGMKDCSSIASRGHKHTHISRRRWGSEWENGTRTYLAQNTAENLSATFEALERQPWRMSRMGDGAANGKVENSIREGAGRYGLWGYEIGMRRCRKSKSDGCFAGARTDRQEWRFHYAPICSRTIRGRQYLGSGLCVYVATNPSTFHSSPVEWSFLCLRMNEADDLENSSHCAYSHDRCLN